MSSSMLGKIFTIVLVLAYLVPLAFACASCLSYSQAHCMVSHAWCHWCPASSPPICENTANPCPPPPPSTLGALPAAISSLCTGMNSLLPIVGMLMITLAALVYASGQIMGAETRARATVWASACLGGALLAFLIWSVSPPILGALFSGSISCS